MYCNHILDHSAWGRRMFAAGKSIAVNSLQITAKQRPRLPRARCACDGPESLDDNQFDLAAERKFETLDLNLPAVYDVSLTT